MTPGVYPRNYMTFRPNKLQHILSTLLSCVLSAPHRSHGPVTFGYTPHLCLHKAFIQDLPFCLHLPHAALLHKLISAKILSLQKLQKHLTSQKIFCRKNCCISSILVHLKHILSIYPHLTFPKEQCIWHQRHTNKSSHSHGKDHKNSH